ncbi:30S ribosomal protein S12 methylthiotransferase RimO [Vallicoccus soli]|uniref:Ribosomal protein uS12 methylthiotransferase RimO n=1 Tax=Vallicoccus soli TaxID=2339232 RepID=A0A3A3Z769_9ACTN|nr:30S ribosomal protein S12 methylthiotransferase RimO [Vallicoccus soli]RJK96565.1 30S ribosomal protein S12 methylthiotransferase RimO [Vallicoccus soli]
MPASSPPAPQRRSVALVTLGCARNEVDSEELAGRLDADGWDLADDAEDADVVVVNTCGFIDAAKKDSVDTLLEAADLKGAARPQAVVAVGCMAERYGDQLATALPEADAVLSFDDYADISARLRGILAGERPAAHVPSDRRRLLPLTPVQRQASRVAVPGHGADPLPEGVAPASGPRVLRRRLGGGPVAPLKLASGCDRRCSFCAIPAFRGAFVSRPPQDVLAEAAWLAGQGVRELVLVSENSTSYGKDLGDLALLEALLPQLTALDGVERVRVSYLQPAEVRPGLVDVLTGTPGVAQYADLSFQHSAPAVLRRMRRFGDTDRFLELLARFRERSPRIGARSNVIVGFPGETGADLDELERFLVGARLDVVGVFGYSAEEGTEAAGLDGALPEHEVRARVERVTALVDELTAQRAEERVGERVEVLVEEVHADGTLEGRAEHQGPEVDGTTVLAPVPGARVGDLVPAVVTGSSGVDLQARAVAGAGAPAGASAGAAGGRPSRG